MKKFIVKRLGLALVSLFLLSLTIFLLMRITGDPAVLLAEPGASAADLDAIRAQFGLDRPLWVQYMSFITHLLRGDFGQSFYYRTDVFELYMSRLPASLMLAAAAMAFSLLLGIPTGIIAAVRVNQWWDSAGKMFALLGLSMPSFWVGLIMILFFSVYLGWLPSSGSGTILHLVMPSIALAGINLVIMVNTAIVVETVFAWPGVGRLLYEGISFRDFPVVQANILMAGTMIVVTNLLVDILYAFIDPRIRFE